MSRVTPEIVALLVGLVGLVGALSGSWIGSRALLEVQKKDFADQDRRAADARRDARNDLLINAVAEYAAQATLHADLCRDARRVASEVPSVDGQRKFLGAEKRLRASTSTLRQLSVRITALSTRPDLQVKVRDLLQVCWHEREEALGRKGTVERTPMLTDAVKAIRSEVWLVINEVRKETGTGAGILDQKYFISGDPRRRTSAGAESG